MAKPDYTITPEQALVFEALERIKMAWVALVAALVLFATVLVVLLSMIRSGSSDKTGEGWLGAISTMLGWAVERVYANLFPSKSKPEQKKN